MGTPQCILCSYLYLLIIRMCCSPFNLAVRSRRKIASGALQVKTTPKAILTITENLATWYRSL